MAAPAERPVCPACGRDVRPGIKCIATYCVWELTVKHGDVVLKRPLRQRIK